MSIAEVERDSARGGEGQKECARARVQKRRRCGSRCILLLCCSIGVRRLRLE